MRAASHVYGVPCVRCNIFDHGVERGQFSAAPAEDFLVTIESSNERKTTIRVSASQFGGEYVTMIVLLFLCHIL